MEGRRALLLEFLLSSGGTRFAAFLALGGLLGHGLRLCGRGLYDRRGCLNLLLLDLLELFEIVKLDLNLRSLVDFNCFLLQSFLLLDGLPGFLGLDALAVDILNHEASVFYLGFDCRRGNCLLSNVFLRLLRRSKKFEWFLNRLGFLIWSHCLSLECRYLGLGTASWSLGSGLLLLLLFQSSLCLYSFRIFLIKFLRVVLFIITTFILLGAAFKEHVRLHDLLLLLFALLSGCDIRGLARVLLRLDAVPLLHLLWREEALNWRQDVDIVLVIALSFLIETILLIL